MPDQLVFIGDSLTQWFDWDSRFPAYRVMNLGISGETVEGLLGRRELIRTQVRDPFCVFLMTGINDIANGHYDIAAPYEEIVRNLTTWYKKTTIVVQSILPVELAWISSDVIRDANRIVRGIAQKFGADYLDVYRLFVDAADRPKQGYLSDDGVHVAAHGYAVWADEVERFLKDREKRR